MHNEQKKQKCWWKRNWQWLVPAIVILLVFTGLIFSSGMDKITSELLQAYADTALYEDALEKVKADSRITELLGDIQPLDKLAIFEGQVAYAEDYKSVTSSIRIVGTKGRASMDIAAKRVDTIWHYTLITIRIKNPPEKKQTIEIVGR